MVKGRNIYRIINKTFYIRVQNKSTLYSCPLEVNKYFKNQLLVSIVYCESILGGILVQKIVCRAIYQFLVKILAVWQSIETLQNTACFLMVLRAMLHDFAADFSHRSRPRPPSAS